MYFLEKYSITIYYFYMKKIIMYILYFLSQIINLYIKKVITLFEKKFFIKTKYWNFFFQF